MHGNIPITSFRPSIRIRDRQTVQELTALIIRMEKETDAHIPGVGILCYQRFMGAGTNILLSTHIINYKCGVVIDSVAGLAPYPHLEGYSEDFVTRIYDMLQEHCPGILQEQRAFYGRHGRSLEALLFRGDSTKKTQ